MDKKIYTVKEVCEKYSITRKTLFYYDRIGLLKPYSRSGAQQHKMYTEDELNVLERIIRLRRCGLSISEIISFMHCSSNPDKQKELLEKVMNRLLNDEKMKKMQIENLNDLMSKL